MKFDISTLRWASILTGLLLIIIAMSACSDSNAPAEDTTKSATTPTGMTADTNRQTPEPEIDLASLDEYLDWCVQTRVPGLIPDGATIRETSASLEERFKTWESRTPPSEFSDFHNTTLANFTALKEWVDAYPGSRDDLLEEVDNTEVLFSLGLLIADIDRAELVAFRSTPVEGRDRLVAAGCISEDFVEMAGTEIIIGESVEATLDNPDEGGTYFFRVKQGERYVIEVVNATLPDLSLSVSGTNVDIREGASGATIFIGGRGIGFWLDEGVERSSVRAVALSSGVEVIEVSGSGAGSYTFTVRADRSPSSPLNVISAWEDSGVRINWDPVDGADYYIIYHDDDHNVDYPDGCRIYIDGRTDGFSCDELASNVVETTYVDPRPDRRGYFYWVVACNDGGCSYPYSQNPVTPAGVRECLAGVWIGEGDSCSVDIPEIDIATNLFEVRDGRGCYGDICADDNLDLNGFVARWESFRGWSIVQPPSSGPPPAGWNATLCRAVNYAEVDEVKIQIKAGIDVNDACQSTTAWYDGFTPLAIAKRQGGPEVEAILVEAGAVDFDSGATPVATPPQPTPAPSATAVPQSTPTSSSPTDRARFEDDTPPGYTAVALSDDGRVWGNPTKYTTDSDPGAVAYMLLGKLMGCNFANLEADRQSTVHIRVEQLGRLSGYEPETVCRATSKSWNAWDGLRITHIRFFDESNEGGVREHEVAFSGEPDSPTPTPTPTPSATPAPTPTTMQSATPTETIPAAPANVRYAVEGSAIRVSWDPAEGANYYNIYHDDFFDSNCSLNVDGTPLL